MSSSSEVRPFGFTQLGDPGRPAAGTRSTPKEAPPDLDALMAEARAAGYALGHQEGVQRGLEEQRASMQRLAQLAERARVDTREYVRLLEQQVVGLTLAVAQKVIEREVAADPTIVLDVVRSAINEVQDATSVHVRAHPQDYALLEAQWHSIGRNSLGEAIVLVSDERVEPGGCLIETAIGHVDGQLSTRFSQVASIFGALLDGEPT
ncbi:MAG: FliH/SctL family protein [Chloroflexota bacterium]